LDVTANSNNQLLGTLFPEARGGAEKKPTTSTKVIL
jgi:hypothetical protein